MDPKKAIIHRIQQGERPWGTDAQIPEDVFKLVQACCSGNPVLRPTASEVANRLLDMLTVESAPSGIRESLTFSSPLNSEYETQMMQMIQERREAAGKAERSKKPMAKPEEMIAPQQFLQLIQLAPGQAHPNTSFLIGAAIWWDLIDVDGIEQVQDRFSDSVHLSPLG